MKVKDIVNKLKLNILAGEAGLNKEIKGVYINDLLSFVMSHGEKNNAWITVQIHPNIIAVAVLNDFSCIIIPENLDVEKITLEKANIEGIPIFQSKISGYELCGKLWEISA